MAKVDWKAKQVKLGSSLIVAVVTLVIGIVSGVSWNN